MVEKKSFNYRETVFTPFLRRFTDEAALDVAETASLYRYVRAAHLASFWGTTDAMDKVATLVAEHIAERVTLPSNRTLLRALDRCQLEILDQETTIFKTATVPYSIEALSLREQVDLRRFLRAQQHFLAHDERVAGMLTVTLENLFGGLVQRLPEQILQASEGGVSFTVPLISLIDQPGDVVDRLIGTLLKPELQEAGLFTSLQRQLFQNVCSASGVVPEKQSHRPLITADESDLPPVALAEAYLSNTPFLDLLLHPMPFRIPEQVRFEHTHVVGGAGHGKTQLLQHMILADLTSPTPPALVIVDSQGDMLRKLEKLDLFNPDRPDSLADRLVIIDPEDDVSPALNMFDMGTDRLEGYSRNHREQIEAGIIELYNYIFASLAAEMTQKQGTAFAYVIRLMLRIPRATIHTLRELMEDPARELEGSPFAPHIQSLDLTSQSFFRTQFFSKAFQPTKQQIARRLYGVLQVPAFDRMFSSRTNRLDMFASLQRGDIVLVNTSKALLKAEASALFGRYVIALALKAAYERVATSEADRRAAFLIVDEASEYFDENLDRLLSQARKYNLGILAAHQYLDQLSSGLRSSVAANTSIKFAGGVSDRDARSLAPDMRTPAEFITSLRKSRNGTQFACYIRNVTDAAISVDVPFGILERSPTMSSEQHARLMRRNRKRFGVVEESAPTGPVMRTPTPLEPDDDDWRS